MRRTTRAHPALPAASVALALAMAGPEASAGFLSAYTGWTEMNECFVCDSTISFAVWRTEGESWDDDGPFQGITKTRLDQQGAPDYKAGYVYLYQVVNTNHNDPSWAPFPEGDLGTFQVLNRTTGGTLFGSGGYLGAVFDDSTVGAGGRGPVRGYDNVNMTLAHPDFYDDRYAAPGGTTPADDPAPDSFASPERNGGDTNPFQVPGGPLIIQGPDLPSDGLPSHSGVEGIGLSDETGTGLAVPSGLTLLFMPSPPLVTSAAHPYGSVASFSWDAGEFVEGEYSPVLFLTSDYGPVYDFGSTQSYGGPFGGLFPGSAGDVPTATPVPASFALLLSALIGLPLVARRARR